MGWTPALETREWGESIFTISPTLVNSSELKSTTKWRMKQLHQALVCLPLGPSPVKLVSLIIRAAGPSPSRPAEICLFHELILLTLDGCSFSSRGNWLWLHLCFFFVHLFVHYLLVLWLLFCFVVVFFSFVSWIWQEKLFILLFL